MALEICVPFAYVTWRLLRHLPAKLPSATAPYISSMVLSRGTLPVESNFTSSVLAVRGGALSEGGEAVLDGVDLVEAASEGGAVCDVNIQTMQTGLYELHFGLGWEVCLALKTTSSFHFLTTAFAFCDTATSSLVRSLPSVLPMSVFYRNCQREIL